VPQPGIVQKVQGWARPATCSSMVSAARPIHSDFRMPLYAAATVFLASFRISRRKTRVVQVNRVLRMPLRFFMTT
jgi:hypothetical protein